MFRFFSELQAAKVNSNSNQQHLLPHSKICSLSVFLFLLAIFHFSYCLQQKKKQTALKLDAATV